MTILACVPTARWAVLGADRAGKIVVGDDLPLAVSTSGLDRLFDPKSGKWAEVNDVIAGAMAQVARHREEWSVHDFVVGFAKAYAPLVTATAEANAMTDGIRAHVAGFGPRDSMAMSFELRLVPNQKAEITRLLDPMIDAAGLPSWATLKETIDSAVFMKKLPPLRKVARLVRKLLTESGGADIDVVAVDRSGVHRMTE